MATDEPIPDPGHPGHVFFTPDQIRAFYEHSGLPAAHRHEPGRKGSGAASAVVAADPVAGLAFLTALTTHMLLAFPFENLSMHYTPRVDVSVAPGDVYAKLLRGALPDGRFAQRGGYCMELNAIFLAVLRSVGFAAHGVPARPHYCFMDPAAGPDAFKAATHQANIVRIGPTAYLSDVGCGPSAPVRPLALTPESAAPTENWGGATMSLARTELADALSAPAMWLYSVARTADTPPVPCYAFAADGEAWQADFALMNYFTSTSPAFWLRGAVIVVRYLTDAAGKIDGTLFLHNDKVKRRRGSAPSEVLRVCRTEPERVAAIEEFFGILLTEEEKAGVFASQVALKAE